MDQKQPVDNDLQKAIDDITNTTNADPVFSDPVAAPSSVPEGDTGELAEPVGPFPAPEIEIIPPAPEPIAPLQSADIPELNLPTDPTLPDLSTPPAPQVPDVPAAPNSAPVSNDIAEIKKAALRDLAPILDKVSDIDALQKFTIYRNILQDLGDYTVLGAAHRTAEAIPDETERAKALLYLVELIDKM